MLADRVQNSAQATQLWQWQSKQNRGAVENSTLTLPQRQRQNGGGCGGMDSPKMDAAAPDSKSIASDFFSIGLLRPMLIFAYP